jgi:hypothetical protein
MDINYIPSNKYPIFGVWASCVTIYMCGLCWSREQAPASVDSKTYSISYKQIWFIVCMDKYIKHVHSLAVLLLLLLMYFATHAQCKSKIPCHWLIAICLCCLCIFFCFLLDLSSACYSTIKKICMWILMDYDTLFHRRVHRRRG